MIFVYIYMRVYVCIYVYVHVCIYIYPLCLSLLQQRNKMKVPFTKGGNQIILLIFILYVRSIHPKLTQIYISINAQ